MSEEPIQYSTNDIVDVFLPTGFVARGKVVRQLTLEGMQRYNVIDLSDLQTVYTVGPAGMRKVV
jgi:hypothetical protein